MGFPGSSAGKESTCNAGDSSSISGWGRSAEGIGYPLQYSGASLVAQLVKESTRNLGDLGSIPGLGRSPEEGNSNALQYSCLEYSVDRGSHLPLIDNLHALFHLVFSWIGLFNHFPITPFMDEVSKQRGSIFNPRCLI